MSRSDYKLGDWVKDIQHGDIYEITKIWPDVFSNWCNLSKKIDGMNGHLVSYIYNTTANFSSLDNHFVVANAARVLYSNNGERR